MTYRRGFGMVTEDMQREAELFYQALTGRTAPRPPAARPRGAPPEVWELYEQTPPPAQPQPYLPAGGRAFAPQAATFNCAPPAFTVLPASFLPTPTTAAAGAVDAALTAAGLDAAQRGRIARRGLEPIAAAFGPRAFTELFARLRWTADDVVRWGARDDDMLVQRLLLHVPGHFRELARRAPGPVEAFVLECLGWAMMASSRDTVAAATRRRWWIPPPPAWTGPLPHPLPGVSADVLRLAVRLGAVDTSLTAGQWNGRVQTWRIGLAGRQWLAETTAARPGLPFYAGLVTVPAHVSTAAARATFATSWNRRVADTDARFPPLAAGAAAVTLDGLRNAAALRECDNADRNLPVGAFADLPLQGVALAYDFPMQEGRRVVERVPVLAQLLPVFTALFQAIRELGWNDLVYQTSGAGCFRGTKHDASARVADGGTQVTVNPFGAPNATTVTRINTLFTAVQRRAVVDAARTARTMSDHGLGAAIDVNVQENGQRRAARPFGSLDPRVVALLEAFHFTWGACFRQTDPMHFGYCQAACAPAPVAAPPAPTGPAPGMLPPGVGPQIA